MSLLDSLAGISKALARANNKMRQPDTLTPRQEEQWLSNVVQENAPTPYKPPKSSLAYRQSRPVYRGSVETETPCGFDFSNVPLICDEDAGVTSGTYTVDEQLITVFAESTNYHRIMIDAIEVIHASEIARDYSKHYAPQEPNPSLYFHEYDGVNTVGSVPYMMFNGLTKTGLVKKYPITVKAESEPSADWMLLNLHYLQTGEIGKARLVYWLQKHGTMIELSRQSNALAVLRITALEPSGERIRLFTQWDS